MTTQPAILGDQRHSKVASGRIDEAIRRVTGEGGTIELTGPRGRFWRERGHDRTTVFQNDGDPVPEWAVKRNATVAHQEPDLPPGDGADQDPIRILDRIRRGGRQTRTAGEPPEQAVRVNEDAQRIPRSASQTSPVEK